MVYLGTVKEIHGNWNLNHFYLWNSIKNEQFTIITKELKAHYNETAAIYIAV